MAASAALTSSDTIKTNPRLSTIPNESTRSRTMPQIPEGTFASDSQILLSPARSS